MAVGLAVGAGVGMLGSGILGYFGAKKQADAAEEAAKQQAAVAREGMANQAALGQQAAGLIGYTTPHAGALLQQSGQQGIGEMMAGRDMALGQLTGFGGQARQDLMGGFGGAQQALGSFLPNSRMEALLSDPQGYMAQDPGYQFRLQQGQQSLDRGAAARGGRISSRAMQEQQQFGQGLASQEFGAAAQRAQVSDAQRMAILGQQAGMSAQAGQAMAGQQSGLGTNLANLFTGSGNALGQAHMGLGTNMSNLLMQGAQGQSNALMGAAGNMNALTGPLMQSMGTAVPYQGGDLGALGNMFGNIGTGLLTTALSGRLGGGGGGGGMTVNGAPALGATRGDGTWNMLGGG